MATVGIISRDVVTKNRILEALKEQGHDGVVINGAVFDGNAFDLIMVDLDDSNAMLALKQHGYKSLAFGSANDEQKLKAAKAAGCERVVKHGEFFKKILPNLKI